MAPVLLVLHIMIALALIGVVLLQRSEGGALGIGGGGSGGFMTGRGAANFLTRVTAGLAAAFFATSLLLSMVAMRSSAPTSILDTPPGKATTPAKGPAKTPATDPQLPPIDLKLPGDAPPATEKPRVPDSK
jgi:preprotein translocase subunit SecG